MKHIVITGASGGIGATLAAQLGAAGHRVALAARREPELREAAARAGHGAIAIPADVTNRVDVERLRDRAIEAFGHVDVWVNNAGRGINRAGARAHRRGARPDDDREREVGALRHAGDCAALHRPRQRPDRQRVVDAQPGAVRDVPFGLQRGQGGAQRADRQRARRSGAGASRHPGHAGDARAGADRLSAQRARRIAADAGDRRARSRSRMRPRRSPQRSSSRSPRSTPTRATPRSCRATFRMSAPSNDRPPPREDDADVRADAAWSGCRAPDDPRQGQRDGPRVLPGAVDAGACLRAIGCRRAGVHRPGQDLLRGRRSAAGWWTAAPPTPANSSRR